MKIKDLFEKNKGKIIEEYRKGIQHNFNTYEEFDDFDFIEINGHKFKKV